nr:hypothetical protein [Tanacetum cinerariifolium]
VGNDAQRVAAHQQLVGERPGREFAVQVQLGVVVAFARAHGGQVALPVAIGHYRAVGHGHPEAPHAGISDAGNGIDAPLVVTLHQQVSLLAKLVHERGVHVQAFRVYHVAEALAVFIRAHHPKRQVFGERPVHVHYRLVEAVAAGP